MDNNGAQSFGTDETNLQLFGFSYINCVFVFLLKGTTNFIHVCICCKQQIHLCFVKDWDHFIK